VFRGQLARVIDANGTNLFGYDFKGRVLKTTRGVIGFSTYTITNNYNTADQVIETSYPGDLARVRYYYTNGVLTTVDSGKGTGAAKDIFYLESGKLTHYRP
jgi:hypothetical protein